jgi:AcrR family transcriptional regulator
MSKSDPTRRKRARGTTADEAANAPVARRRTQAERSEATRKLILDASVRVIARKGLAAMRMEDVEAEAGVSRGAQLHHFAAKRDLLLATFAYVNDRSLERSQQRTQFAGRFKSVDEVINAVVNDATEFFFGVGFLIEFALVFGNADREIGRFVRKTSRRSRFAIEEAWRGAMESQGLPADFANDLLNLTLNTVRGFALRRFIEDDPRQRTHLTQVWQKMIRAYLQAQLDPAVLACVRLESDSDNEGGGIDVAAPMRRLKAAAGAPSKDALSRKEP